MSKAHEALDKMADNARELGLDYEPVPEKFMDALKFDVALREALAEQPTQLPFGVGGGLVAIKTLLSRDPCVHANTAIQMIEAILAEQPAQQEPAGSVYRYGKDSSGKEWHGIRWTASGLDLPDGTLIYTSPPAQRTWVGLTDDEIYPLYSEPSSDAEMVEFARAIEAKLKEKNQ